VAPESNEHDLHQRVVGLEWRVKGVERELEAAAGTWQRHREGSDRKLDKLGEDVKQEVQTIHGRVGRVERLVYMGVGILLAAQIVILVLIKVLP